MTIKQAMRFFRYASVLTLVLVVSLSVVRAEITDDAKRAFNAGVEFEKAKKADSAIASYEEAVAASPDYLDAHINVGALYYQQGDLTKAASHLEAAIKLDSTRASAHKNLGLVRQQAKDYPAAVTAFTTFLAMQPTDAGAWASLAETYKASKNNAKAVEAYEKAVAADPADHVSAFNLGNLLQKQEKYSQAINAYNKAIAANPKYVNAYYNRAICAQLVDQDTCVDEYEAFIQAAGTSKKWAQQVAQAKEIVKQIKEFLDLQGG